MHPERTKVTSSISAELPEDTTVVEDPKTKKMILASMCVALMAVIASMSGLNVAQQELSFEFGASQNAILWIINIYILVLAALLMPIGAIGDRWGRKPVLLTGLVIFGFSSLAAGLATSTMMMIVARAIAGAGAAMIMPVTLSVITSSFPPEERPQAIGIWAGVAGGGGMIGMFVSAAMVDLATWRWSFALPVVLVIAAITLAYRYVPNSREDSEHPFDFLGSLFSLFAIGGLVLGIHEGPERGWTNTLTILGLAVGLVAGIAFVIWELKSPDPLLDVRVFKNRRLSTGAVTLLSLFAVMSGIFLVLFPYFQAVLGWSALRSSVAMLPMAAIMMPASALVPKVSMKLGIRRTLLIGLVLGGTGLALLATMASVEGGYFSVLPGLLVIGLGLGFCMTPSTEAITSALPDEKQGVASALNDTTREIGGAVGVALLGAILASGYKDAILPELEGMPDELVEVASSGIGQAYMAAAQAGEFGPTLIQKAQVAFVEGWTSSMWIGVGITAAIFVFVYFVAPKRPGDHLVEDLIDQAEIATQATTGSGDTTPA